MVQSTPVSSRIRPALPPVRSAAAVLVCIMATVLAATPARAATWSVPGDFATIQAAIDAAASGDTVAVAAGAYNEDLDFLGKDIVVRGSGPDTLLVGTGEGPVVTFIGGETRAAVLDSFTVAGGAAEFGGGIFIAGASPTVQRNVIRSNQASRAGSGVYVASPSTALLRNNAVVHNSRIGTGDPHAIQVVGAAPAIVNNTILANDSNGVFLTGGAAADVRNNIIMRNGSRGPFGDARGRGICNFTSASTIAYNLFYRNRKAALLQGGIDWRRVSRAERKLELPTLEGNRDFNPRFAVRRLPRTGEDFALDQIDFCTCGRRGNRTVGIGDPDPAYANEDGSRNTPGHLGGPTPLVF
jgi:hypothetical protein